MSNFGRSMLEHWLLDPDCTYLNHGTVGAPPRRVLQVQQTLRDEIERQPARFMLRELNGEHAMPWRTVSRLREASDKVAAFVGARPDDLVFVPNVTTGMNAVLGSLPLGPGDEVVITDMAYGAITLTAQAVCERSGAALRTVHLEHPIRDAAAVVEPIVAALTAHTRLVVVDHITARTALVLPVAAIAAACHARGVPVLVDGAHAPGAIALDIPSLGVDWRRQPASGRTRLAGAGFCAAPARRRSFTIQWCRGGGTAGSATSSSTRRPPTRPAIWRRPRASRCCANGVSMPVSPTCMAWRGRPPRC